MADRPERAHEGRPGLRSQPILLGTVVAAAVLLGATAWMTGSRGTEPTATDAAATIGSASRPTLVVGFSEGGATLPGAATTARTDPVGPPVVDDGAPVTAARPSAFTSTPTPTSDPTPTVEVSPPPPPGPSAVENGASGGSGGRFETLPPGSTLPSGQICATRVRPTPENVPENTPYNQTPGRPVTGTYLSINTAIAGNDYEQRLDGAFVGTTDEIIQWAACKWGFDEDIVRAQVYAESSWYAGKLGDCGEQTHERTGGCASVGLIQVRSAETGGTHHPGVYPIAVDSTAMNLDYALAVKRLCFEGWESWLAETGDYRAGDEWNCLGRWFSGSWADGGTRNYQGEVRRILAERPWEGPHVGCPGWRDNFHCR